MLKDAKEWMGITNFVWFFGVIEDIIDPLNIGRVKVRCYGWHTEDREVLPPEGLPSRGLGDVYKRQVLMLWVSLWMERTHNNL